MATIDITRSHSLERETAKERAEQFAKGMEEKLGIRWRWEGEDIAFDAPSGMAKGATGRLKVSAESVHVAIDLPLMLRPMKGMVTQKVNERLDQLLS